jgi:hypothetical protein
MKNKKYHTVGTFPKSNRKIAERSKINSPNTQIHGYSAVNTPCTLIGHSMKSEKKVRFYF